MGKTGKWIRHFLTGKKDKEKKENCQTNPNSTISVENLSTPIAVAPNTSKEKRRWSFRRSSAAGPAPKGANTEETNGTTEPPVPTALDWEDEHKKHAMAMKAATAAAADAALAAAQAAAAVIRLTAIANGRASANEEDAAIKIQSVFRTYLARKALCALRGLVKLQALVRGYLVRKQATATLRCMQALVTVQARARAQRILAVEDVNPAGQRPSVHRKSTQEHRIRQANYDFDREEKIKVVEMDLGEPKGTTRGRNSYSHHHHQQQSERVDLRFSMHCTPKYNYSNPENYQASPDPSAIADMSPRTSSGHFEDYSFGTTQSSPQHYSAASKTDPTRVPFALPQPDYAETVSYDYPLFPNYMSNTESSRAKVRSQSAPKSRPEFERQPSRRRPSMEGRNIPRAVRMQRSSSHAGATAQNYQFPWHLKLDRSSVTSVKDSECGSIRTVLTNAEY